MIGALVWAAGSVIVFFGIWILPIFMRPKHIGQYFLWAVAFGVVGAVCLMAFRFAVMPQVTTAFGQ